MRPIYLCLIFCFLTMCNSNTNPEKDKDENILADSTESVSGVEVLVTENSYQCDYLNEPLPDSIPRIFAKDVISTGVDESSFEINKYGNEMIFAREGKIMMLKKTGTTWGEPTVAKFSGTHIDGECCFSPSGDKIFYASRRTLPGATDPLNTWVSDKQDNTWSDSYPLKSPLYDQTTHAVTVSESGNLYCSGIDLFRFSNGQYSPRAQLSDNVKGTHPYIAPDESYILFCRRAEGRQDPDICVSFKNQESWSEPLSLNNQINTNGLESNPFVTPDGKFLFFIRKYDVYWVRFDIDEIKTLSL